MQPFWLMCKTQVRVLTLDEVHNILSGSRLQQRRPLNLCAGAGTPEGAASTAAA